MFERILTLIKGLSFFVVLYFVVGWGIIAIGWSFVGACSSSIVGCCLKLQKFSTLHHGC
jgi:uncharacterized membrane-anchored protein